MDTYMILIGVLALCNALLLVWLIRLEKRLKRVFGGKQAHELESVLQELQKTVGQHIEQQKSIMGRIMLIEKRLQKSLRGIKTIRFNPFADQGSNQSFATAIIDDHGDGVVLSSLYSRERVSVFAKPVEKGVPTYELTEEEQTVLERAKNE